MEKSWSLAFYLGIENMVLENRFGRDAKCWNLVAWEHFKLWILKANLLPFHGAKIGSTLLLIFFVAGALCLVADHWVHKLPLH